MLELGSEHDAAHVELGRAVAAASIDVVVVIGDGAEGIARGATGRGCEVIVTAGRGDAADWVRNNAMADDVVLVKASRAGGLEQVAELLLADL